MARSTPPQILLRITVETASGLAGGDAEQRGFVASWASWGDTQRDAACVLLPANARQTVDIGPLALPALSAVRGDDTIWIEQRALSRKSGIAALDLKESKNVQRTQAAGILSLPLKVLLTSALAKPLDAPLIDGTLQMALFMQARVAGGTALSADQQQVLLNQATQRAHKGTVQVQALLVGGTPASAKDYLAAVERSLTASAGMMYQTQPMIEAMMRMREAIMAAHSRHFFAADNGGAPLWPINPKEASLDNLHLVAYQSEQGWLPAAYYTVAASAPAHAYTKESALFAEQQVAASLHRAGLEHAVFLAAIREQHARDPKDATVSPDYLRALAVILDAATFAANTVNYTSDLRYPRPPGNASAAAEAETLPTHARMMINMGMPLAGYARAGSVHKPYLRGHYKMRGDTRVLQRRLDALLAAAGAGKAEDDADAAVGVEDFGTGVLTGRSNADDCEGMEVTASAILDIHEDLAALGNDTDTPLLCAAARVCARRIIYDVGASVTSAYVDTEGKTLTLHKGGMEDLPTIGDEVDQRSEIGGHCHGVWVPKWIAAQWYARGGVDLAKELPELAAAIPTAWDHHIPVSEGTGSTDPFVRPTGEIYGTPDPGARIRAMYTTLRDTTPVLVDTFKLDGLAYYDKPQPADRRMSPFYRGVAFFMARRVHTMNPLYGNCAIVNTLNKTRGIEIGQLLRTPAAPGTALVSAYASMGRAKWDALVEPVARCVLNQMPRSVYARFAPQAGGPGTAFASAASVVPARATFEEAMGRCNLALSRDIVLGALALPLTLPLGMALDRLARGQRLHPPGRATRVPNATPGAVITLYAQPWRLADAKVARRLNAELSALKRTGAISGYDFVRNRPLSQCEDTIELRLWLV